jgi:hypothetical protein
MAGAKTGTGFLDDVVDETLGEDLPPPNWRIRGNGVNVSSTRRRP